VDQDDGSPGTPITVVQPHTIDLNEGAARRVLPFRQSCGYVVYNRKDGEGDGGEQGDLPSQGVLRGAEKIHGQAPCTDPSGARKTCHGADVGRPPLPRSDHSEVRESQTASRFIDRLKNSLLVYRETARLDRGVNRDSGENSRECNPLLPHSKDPGLAYRGRSD
jgi:hypothetical protein